jgi:hypothetical protein
MADSIGIPIDARKPVKNPVGVYAVPDLGWYAFRMQERRGPFPSREQADAEYMRMCEISPGIVESWLAIAKMTASGLLLMSTLMVVVFILLWGAVWLVR